MFRLQELFLLFLAVSNIWKYISWRGWGIYIIVLYLLPKRHPTEKKPIKANYFHWVYGEVTGIEVLITSV